jgi:hypothetical protein
MHIYSHIMHGLQQEGFHPHQHGCYTRQLPHMVAQLMNYRAAGVLF